MIPTAKIAVLAPAARENSVADLIGAFFSGRSANTIAAYRADLEDFRIFVGADTAAAASERLLQGSNGDANRIVLSWRSHLVELGRSSATVNRKLSAVRALIALGRTLGLITWSIDISNLRSQAYTDTRGPKREGVALLLATAAAQADKRKAARDVALVRLLHDTALRRGEVCALDLEDVDLAASQIKVLGKGRREKVSITLPAPTRVALAAWIAVRGAQSGPLFTSLDPSASKGSARRLTGAGLWHIIVTLGRAAGMTVRPHGLRHSAITAALDATKGDVRAVQRFSRHADIRTLQIYDDNREDLAGQIAGMIAV